VFFELFTLDDPRLLLGKQEIAFGLGNDSSCGRATAIQRPEPERKDDYVGGPNINPGAGKDEGGLSNIVFRSQLSEPLLATV
jgi:hypothetical protein